MLAVLVVAALGLLVLWQSFVPKARMPVIRRVPTNLLSSRSVANALRGKKS